MGEGELGALVRRAGAGDREAAGEIARRYEGLLRARIRRRLGRRLRARVETDDIFQSTIAASLLDLEGFEYRGEQEFLGWLTTVAERRIRSAGRFHGAARRDIERERNVSEAGEVAADRTSPTQGAVRSELAEGLRQAIARLPQPDRRVMEMRSFRGLGFQEIAEATGLSDRNSARWVFQRALKKMEDDLESEAKR
ncbi:MAG: RNA polymerase sigma factor [Planctomycetota bacterium]